MNNDPAKWYGPFYYNKRFKNYCTKIESFIRGTFNMASPYAILIFIVIIASIVITAVFSI